MDKKELKTGQKIETKDGIFEIIKVGKIYSLNNKDFEEAIVANVNGVSKKVKFEDVIRVIEEKEGK